MGLSLFVTSVLETISGAWIFIIEAGAGLGLVLILRWYWWRINAWSEIAAIITPLVTYAFIRYETNIQFPQSLFYIVAVTTVVWLALTFATRPTASKTLQSFYRRIHPGGRGWRKVAQMLPEVKPDSHYGWLFLDWVAGIFLVYFFLFGVGKLVLGEYGQGALFLALGLLAAGIIYWGLSKHGSEEAGN